MTMIYINIELPHSGDTKKRYLKIFFGSMIFLGEKCRINAEKNNAKECQSSVFINIFFDKKTT